ncbi:hypothetical protein JAAARDRAFT_38989 [Jaapia argillacea MUCL 33604]|uniref:Uncharacterized protein n=1 Tax=Jaapia argillacea MUCL 33604 TaxID=933084 RepID=A0A067PIK6_9AGAM|nr:hypothetical protein JAAARDRAFT_38989 [Jaapia argillacea MUCL 33604]
MQIRHYHAPESASSPRYMSSLSLIEVPDAPRENGDVKRPRPRRSRSAIHIEKRAGPFSMLLPNLTMMVICILSGHFVVLGIQSAISSTMNTVKQQALASFGNTTATIFGAVTCATSLSCAASAFCGNQTSGLICGRVNPVDPSAPDLAAVAHIIRQRAVATTAALHSVASFSHARHTSLAWKHYREIVKLANTLSAALPDRPILGRETMLIGDKLRTFAAALSHTNQHGGQTMSFFIDEFVHLESRLQELESSWGLRRSWKDIDSLLNRFVVQFTDRVHAFGLVVNATSDHSELVLQSMRVLMATYKREGTEIDRELNQHLPPVRLMLRYLTPGGQQIAADSEMIWAGYRQADSTHEASAILAAELDRLRFSVKQLRGEIKQACDGLASPADELRFLKRAVLGLSAEGMRLLKEFELPWSG